MRIGFVFSKEVFEKGGFFLKMRVFCGFFEVVAGCFLMSFFVFPPLNRLLLTDYCLFVLRIGLEGVVRFLGNPPSFCSCYIIPQVLCLSNFILKLYEIKIS